MHNTITCFQSFLEEWEPILKYIVSEDSIHAKWINTLSFLENNGAKKISASEHPTQVQEEVLKHAAEEFRHAYYLKSQITKVSEKDLDDYTLNNILGGTLSKYYLHLLDLQICAWLKENYSLSGYALKNTAYILVTYAIELRATELYDIYYKILKEQLSKVTIKSIILEEIGHLAEMELALTSLTNGPFLLSKACEFEANLCRKLLSQLNNELKIESRTLTYA